jgi:glucose/arabinose dehydrogenase
MNLRFPTLALITLFFCFNSAAQMAVDPFVPNVNRITGIGNCGDNRIFIVEQQGRILVSDLQGNLQPDTFLNIVGRVRSTGGEQGLLGLAFSPQYAVDGKFYVNYTNLTGNTIVSRFTVFPANSSVADSTSEEILMTIVQPFTNHNGGDMHFGPDGYLYIATGDGGSGGDPGNRAQNLLDPLGKILRIDVSAATGYSIPASNPFGSNPNADARIWSYGWRNPWRFSFDSRTGDMWIADVGQNLWEEVNFEPAGSAGGANYGWRCYEATHPFNLTGCQPVSQYVMPVHEIAHGPDCSVTGGFVYRGALSHDWYGKYFFTDYCNGAIRSLHLNDTGGVVFTNYGSFNINFITTFGQDRYGEMYMGRNSTGVFKMTNADCKPVASPAPDDTIMTVAGSYLLSTPFHPELTYQWYFNGSLLAGQTGSAYLASVSGDYRVLVSRNDTCFNLSKTVTVLLGQQNGFQLFPNPSVNGEVNLVWSLNFPNRKEIEVFDSSGRLLKKKTVLKELAGTTLDLYGFPKGVYFVRINHDGSYFTQKLIIQ